MKFMFPSHNNHLSTVNAGERGQGIIEYSLLIILVSVVAIGALTVAGPSVQNGLIQTCAELGVDKCETLAEQNNSGQDGGQGSTLFTSTPAPDTALTQTPEVTLTASPTPSITPTLQDPDPTREPIFTSTATSPAFGLKGLTVFVLDEATGQPAAGVSLQVRTDSGRWIGDARTDGEGKANFSVADGGYKVSLYTGQWWSAAQVKVSGSTQVNINLKALTVAVIDDATGGPAANIPVQLRTSGNGWVGDKRTDANGRAVFSVVDGGYRAHLYTGQWWKASEATVSASTSMEVHLKALTVAVIDDATGGPAANIPVQLRTASDGWVGDKRTDANGRAIFSVVDGGYRAHLYTGQWWKASEATVSASTSMEVHLKALTVAVIDDATGGPAANIPVQLRTASDGWVGDKRTDANGRAVFSVVDGGYRAHLYTGQWWKASEATVSASTSMEVHLKALTVKVVDNNKGGGPAANISIQLRTASDGWVGDKRTDTKGRAVFPVVDGGYRVYIYVGQQWKKAVEVTVSASTNINVRLKGLEFDTDVDGDDDHGNDN